MRYGIAIQTASVFWSRMSLLAQAIIKGDLLVKNVTNQLLTQLAIKKPQIIRTNGLKQRLKNSLLNYNAEWINPTMVKLRSKRFNFVDLFCGAGGISCGLSMAGLRPLLGVEINEVAAQTYARNFPGAKVYNGDIKNLDTNKIRQLIGDQTVHIVTGGFPCQGFSVAGFRDPDDKRNVLYKEIVRIVKELKPWFVILENVPGVCTMKDGEVWKTIVRDFESIGYPDMSVEILEAADYGVAQLRPRAVFIANRFGMKNPYPKPLLSPEKYVAIEEAIDDLRYKPPDHSINHEWTRHSKEMEHRLSKVLPGGSLYASFFDAWKRQYKGIPAMTIKENHGGTHIHPDLNRVISAREMARLQSFPDEFIFAGTMKQAMWQIGNAVAPLKFKYIGMCVKSKLQEVEKQDS